jgi:hypothetical protein
MFISILYIVVNIKLILKLWQNNELLQVDGYPINWIFQAVWLVKTWR